MDKSLIKFIERTCRNVANKSTQNKYTADLAYEFLLDRLLRRSVKKINEGKGVTSSYLVNCANYLIKNFYKAELKKYKDLTPLENHILAKEDFIFSIEIEDFLKTLSEDDVELLTEVISNSSVRAKCRNLQMSATEYHKLVNSRREIWAQKYNEFIGMPMGGIF